MTSSTVVRLSKITKKFPGVIANDCIDFELRKGEIHALLGENGAGKTTLMNILYGLARPDEGEIHVHGKKVSFYSPIDAINHKIGMLHQNFMLIPSFTVTENIALCLKSPKGLKLDKVKNIIVKVIKKYEISGVDPDAIIHQLSAQEQQLVEIVKMLCLGQDILIFDEPTSVLTTQQIETFLNKIKNMANIGHSIIFISHKLDEVLAVSDRVTVLRGGKVIGCLEQKNADKRELVRMMVGRDLMEIGKPRVKRGTVALEVHGLQVIGGREITRVNDVSFSVHEGEIFGIAGIAGNGQVELAEAIAGVREIARGKVIVHGCEVTKISPKGRIERGISFIPPKPKEIGTALSLSVTENIALKDYTFPQFSSGIFLKWKTINEYAEKLIAEHNIMTFSRNLPVGLLSGGNLMKLVVGREIARDSKLLVAFDPTVELDVGARDFIHQKILEAREKNVAILLISSDLDEILSLSDRIAVIFKGQLRETPKGFTNGKLGLSAREQIGLMMVGEAVGDGEPEA
jgi:simple sugar transport system ATP-binding protein